MASSGAFCGPGLGRVDVEFATDRHHAVSARLRSVLVQFGTDYREVNHTNIGDDVLRSFFDGTPEYRRLDNVQVFDYAGLEGRLLSSSYVPSADDARYRPMLAASRALCSAAR